MVIVEPSILSADFTRLGDAVKQAEDAVALAPSFDSTWRTLGVAKYRAGDWAGAKDALEKADELSAEPWSVDRFFLAMTYWRTGDRGLVIQPALPGACRRRHRRGRVSHHRIRAVEDRQGRAALMLGFSLRIWNTLGLVRSTPSPLVSPSRGRGMRRVAAAAAGVYPKPGEGVNPSQRSEF